MELCKNHPGINDLKYLERRKYFHNLITHFSNKIEKVVYTDYENKLWGLIFCKLKHIHLEYACTSYLKCFKLLEDNNIFSSESIPQILDINNFLLQRTGFQLKPVTGLIESREFLNSLADRIFNCTIYIRHESKPFYTPEPDLVHEFLGHVPLFADEEFANLSERIGKASLNMSDEDILKLTRFYWFTIEFGLCDENEKTKVYGAGILSSIGEMEYSISQKANVNEFKVENIIKQDYPVDVYQPQYFKVKSFEDAKRLLEEYLKKKIDIK